MSERPHRVLSIQSHVVSGYVGNKAATFPLQLLGFDVDVINTVQLSNHTAYRVFPGDRYDGALITKLEGGLEENGLLGYSHVLTGYLGSASMLPAIAQLVKKVKELNPQALFVLDPVMGDDGRLYVPQAIVDSYKDDLTPLADVLVPNSFEAEVLTGVKVVSFATASEALSKLHDYGARFVAITSASFPLPDGASDAVEYLYLLGSYRHRTSAGQDGPAVGDHRFVIRCKKLPAYFTGTGDLFAALLLAHLDSQLGRESVPSESGAAAAFTAACEIAVSVIQAVLKRTMEYYASNDRGQLNADMKVKCTELRLIQSRDILARSDVDFRAEPWPQGLN
ncbi:pyridoxal kinase-like protein [Hyaloraphidium curvatum]|nr:pyridoxal kinase-like protein [Hyaloraphidium curvatum]